MAGSRLLVCQMNSAAMSRSAKKIRKPLFLRMKYSDLVLISFWGAAHWGLMPAKFMGLNLRGLAMGAKIHLSKSAQMFPVVPLFMAV